ncbi:rRNA maturation RNase YbeY [Flavobacterium rakeshii]|uniref:Endoribonuclease YbeY n=1 Tax=Flavobacterium rakeshii TaxID=1038845 RepID=A0A6N8HHT1_9FLAO|nr:rRNA maturation RNase YbeY [Flavobacterium rakeshii]MEE1897265.1 rRNA maturation RNase YbeY [Flavobacterium rakeshii]MUV05216.1 rRNA maturation RNase YbeY [Flavobacterium rakeshii]
MISFNYETDFELENETLYEEWVSKIIDSEDKTEGEINYIFCDDEYLLQKNIEFLNHDTLTDIISFDYTMGNLISGDIFISVERVKDNAADFNTEFIEELKRVMAHGILHYCGYKDKTEEDSALMRDKENQKINLFNQ